MRPFNRPVRRTPPKKNHGLRFETLESRKLLAASVADGFIGPIGQPDSAQSDDSEQSMVSVSIADATVVEGNAGSTTIEFEISLSAATDGPVSVNVEVTDQSARAIRIDRIASGLSEPIYVTVAPDDPDTMFVVEQDGIIRRLDLDTNIVASTPFLTVGNLSTGGERGLLGLAFHPDYASNRRFFVYTTDSGRDTLIREYTAHPDGLTADPVSEKAILGFDQPFGNHNGGWIDFGPDGYLYIASGDGGSANDPELNAQDITNNLLGKILRIDVDGDDFPADANRNYAIPSTNPFVGITGDNEIWSYGLRNPWRNSFDRETGDLLIADVGQGRREEINFQPASSSGGENYGWRAREGTIATPAVGGPKPNGAIDPIYDYLHDRTSTGGYSVTGGYVYRGPIPELRGNYFFADYVNDRIWSIRPDGSDPSSHDGTNYQDFTDWTDLLAPDVGSIVNVSSFGEDEDGNLYIVDRDGQSGEIYRISNGADYRAENQTVTIEQGETVGQFRFQILGDRFPESNEQVRVALVSSLNATIADGVALGTIENDDAPQVSDVVLDRDSDQRSVIEELTVTFDSAVEVDTATGGTFKLVNLSTEESVNLTTNVLTNSEQTTVLLRFADGPSVTPNENGTPTLSDGRYRLTIASNRVEIGNLALDGNGDGSAGGNYDFGDEASDRFFRLFGDGDGDGDVDGQDYGGFGLAFLKTSDDAGFNPIFDFDGDYDVDGQDYGQFGLRFLTQIG